MNGFVVLKIVIFAYILHENVVASNLMEKSTLKCEFVCNITTELSKDLQGDCQRGCLYFNIEFLMSPPDITRHCKLKTFKDKCESSCNEAYVQKNRRDACFVGCKRMSDIQQEAPNINAWYIFMGSVDKYVVLLPKDYDALSDKDWVSLDKYLNINDYEYIDDGKVLEVERVSATFSEKVINLSVPSWLWCIPFLMILWLIWTAIGAHPLDDFKQGPNEIISNDKTMYPSLAVLPPKYSDIEKEFFNETDDENVSSKEVRT